MSHPGQVVTGLRRRGEALVGAIHEAVVAELAERGYDGLSIEAVAERAHTGKASIYRRWPTKLELVLDAVDAFMPALGSPPDTGSLRSDLLVVLRRFARHMNSRAGGALLACMTDVKQHGELTVAVHDRLVPPRRAVLRQVLAQGVERGEVRPDAMSDRVAEVGPSLLLADLQSRGVVRDADVVGIVDEVLLPLLRPTGC